MGRLCSGKPRLLATQPLKQGQLLHRLLQSEMINEQVLERSGQHGHSLSSVRTHMQPAAGQLPAAHIEYSVQGYACT
jgi:hypothetical protein